MSEQLSYEALIAAKLEALQPMPAMADAIWGRIEQDLDKEMPIERPKGPGGISGSFLWPGAILVAVIIAALLFWNNQQQSSIRNKRSLIDSPSTETPAPSSGGNPDRSDKPSMAIPFKSGNQAQVDSSNNSEQVPEMVLPKKDSIANTPAETIIESTKPSLPKTNESLLPPVKKIDSQVTKKPRGVPGINPNDYRIIPGGKKDSSKQN